MRHLCYFGDLRDFELFCASGLRGKGRCAKLSFEPFYSGLHGHIDLFGHAGVDSFRRVGLLSDRSEDQKTEVDLNPVRVKKTPRSGAFTAPPNGRSSERRGVKPLLRVMRYLEI